MSSRARRNASSSSFTPGFYRALDTHSSADLDVMQSCSSPASTLRIATDYDELPSGCYLVERLISMRKQKVGHNHNDKNKVIVYSII